MPRCQTSADLQIELEMTVEGTVDYADTPIEVDLYTADKVEDLFYRNPRTKVYTSILQGVDSTNPEVQKLLSNLLELYDTEADEALAEANQ